MKRKLLLSLILYSVQSITIGQIRLPQIIRDSMILQRGSPINIWGWAGRGETIELTFKGKRFHAKTGNDERWKIQLPPQREGGPYHMSIAGKSIIELKDILIGDVWLCAGQSNMVHQLKLHDVSYAHEIETANNPFIRQFWVPNVTSLDGPIDDLPYGFWKTATKEYISNFSAVAYFFAKKLYEKYHVPIGIVNASWGGTPIEAWMSKKSLEPFPEYQKIIQFNRDHISTLSAHNTPLRNGTAEIGDSGLTQRWFDATYSDKAWRRIAIPGYWEDQGIKDLDGTVWYRREIEVPAAMAGKAARIFLGRIVDADEVYINGEKIGNTSYLYPQRRYLIKAGLLTAGKNLIAIRVSNYSGKGGFVPDKPYELIADTDTIDLTGYWKYKVGEVYVPSLESNQEKIFFQNQPGSLFNAMLSPVIPYSLRGFVWYQGESNTDNADEYAALQNAMIIDWRRCWSQVDLPFLFVQLPGFMDYSYVPRESQWALFREAQARSLLLPNTAMAVTIDVGEWNDIHPDNKKAVGDRLSLLAMELAYKEKGIAEGPAVESVSVENNQIILVFRNVGSGLATADGQPVQEMAIAGKDKIFFWAKAIVEYNRIILTNEHVPEPMFVRYAWADDPVNPNLINKEGFPAMPFRSDR